ncbi:putative serine/threonine-protein kinase [Vitis vinifera]|uniref:Putative serine/threonine-protein kinase n=1 Tax=Vitis vinifera TaxID=29760 RepID=A0A438EXU6_VITVI|nr:putative serine/threonine-protein kinase [Vitis vinifera]
MGCVQSKRASRDDPSAAGESDRQRELEELSNALKNVVKGRKEGMEVARGWRGRRLHVPEIPRRRSGGDRRPEPYLRSQRGWPSWLLDALGDGIQDWTPRCANSFEKLDKIGQGTYSNVYKARDLITGKIVALKKVSLYLVFEYMEHDLAGLVGHGSYLSTSQGRKFTEPQVKCFMKQLLSGLEHCHNQGVLHRDIKGSNLLINNEGILKIADFGLATFFDPDRRQPMTSRVVTLWYRPPELLLGATYYGVGVDLWSAGCILAELLGGKPIMPGRTEVEQVHKIFKLCGSPSEEYWKKSKLPHATIFKPQQPYKRCVAEAFKDFPCSSLPLIEALLSIDPDDRGTATSALNSEFFTTEPYACEPSSLPKCPPTKEIDVIKLRDEARRQRGVSGKANVVDGNRRVRARDRGGRAVPAPEANAELQANLDVCCALVFLLWPSGCAMPLSGCSPGSVFGLVPLFICYSYLSNPNKEKVEECCQSSDGCYHLVKLALNQDYLLEVESDESSKFREQEREIPASHQDGAVGFPHTSRNGPVSFGATDTSFSSSFFNLKHSTSVRHTGTAGGPSKRKSSRAEPQTAPSRSSSDYSRHPQQLHQCIQAQRAKNQFQKFLAAKK